MFGVGTIPFGRFEPGMILNGKKVKSWHTTDTEHHFFHLGHRYQSVCIEFTDRTKVYVLMKTKLGDGK